MGEAILDSPFTELCVFFVSLGRRVLALLAFQQAIATWVHAVTLEPALGCVSTWISLSSTRSLKHLLHAAARGARKSGLRAKS